jgi:transketolase
MEILTQVHATNLVRWAKDKPEVLVLSGDLTAPTEAHLFRDAYPERFFSMGLTEQNMMSFAAGLAREGFVPLVHTFGVFMYRRALDQIAISIAYPSLRVRMFGFLPGVTTPGGVTHQAIDDIAVLRGLPNLTILECGDATEVESVLDAIHPLAGPVYVRMIRGECVRLFPADAPLQVGRARLLGPEGDITLLSSGVCTEEALRARALLEDRGVPLRHLHVSTLKPFGDPRILEAVERARRGVITMENHTIVGGLGSATAELIATHGVAAPLCMLGVRDQFLHGASKPYLMREYGLDARALIQQVERLLHTDFAVRDEELSAVGIGPSPATAVA